MHGQNPPHSSVGIGGGQSLPPEEKESESRHRTEKRRLYLTLGSWSGNNACSEDRQCDDDLNGSEWLHCEVIEQSVRREKWWRLVDVLQ